MKAGSTGTQLQHVIRPSVTCGIFPSRRDRETSGGEEFRIQFLEARSRELHFGGNVIKLPVTVLDEASGRSSAVR